jgi:[histone H4]-N-methyl-L-lysine20 N-methyltransferase
MKKYISLYLPDCPFEILGTNRYKITSYEAKIIARKPIGKGQEIKYLYGTRVPITKTQKDELDQRMGFFSIFESDLRGTSLGLGPVRFVNSDCESNAKIFAGRSKITIMAIKDIKIGEEITATYGKNCFGDLNCECLCQSCEDTRGGSWSSGGPRVRGDYLTSGSDSGSEGWTHSGCLGDTAVQEDDALTNACLVCKRHMELYQHQWPQTKPSL